jgi:hypothetical protein
MWLKRAHLTVLRCPPSLKQLTKLREGIKTLDFLIIIATLEIKLIINKNKITKNKCFKIKYSLKSKDDF